MKPITLAGLFAAVSANAASVATPGDWDLYVGTRRTTSHVDEAGCRRAAAALPPGRYGCRSITVIENTADPVPVPPPPAPAPTPVPAPTPSPAGPVLYFSTSGNDANPGTEASPKRDWTIGINSRPACTQLLLKRGDVWTQNMVRLENMNVASCPLVLDAYGTGPAPVINVASGTALEVGGWNNSTMDGPYVIRNVKLDGRGTGQWGIWIRDSLRGITLENVEITGFGLAIHSQPKDEFGGMGSFVLRNSLIHRNRDMGMLGKYTNSTIEGNTFEANNFSGSALNHAIYLSGTGNQGHNGVMRNNRFLRNSTVDGECRGGNVTAHGTLNNWLIEGNLIEQDRSAGGCYGFSITPGYTTPEWFRNFVIRGNTVVNAGNVSIAVGAAPGIVIEGNKIIQSSSIAGWAGVQVPTGVDGSTINAGDDVDAGAIVRNNTICYPNNPTPLRAIVLSGAGSQQSGNVVLTGAEATTGVCAR